MLVLYMTVHVSDIFLLKNINTSPAGIQIFRENFYDYPSASNPEGYG